MKEKEASGNGYDLMEMGGARAGGERGGAPSESKT